MRRTFAILSFIAGINLAQLPVRAQGVDAAQQQFVDAFLSVRKGEEQEKAGDHKAALATYRSALGTLMRIKQENPKWQTDLLDFRIKRTMEAVDLIQERMGGTMKGGTMKGTPGNDPGLGLPPLTPDADPLNPPVAVPKNRKVKAEALIDDADPLSAVKQRLASLESQLSEANDRLREEKDRNEKLRNEIADAMEQRKKAEVSQKKAQQLADVFQASIHELKSAGDANGVRAKELEAKLAAANRESEAMKIEFEAQEERVSQLVGRSQVLAGIAQSAGTLPKQVKELQAKLDAEQAATAQQGELSKKREADLKNQIATLSKDKAESATAVAEMKSLQAKLDLEQKTSASEAQKSKKREEDLKGQIATLSKERKDDREELVRLRDLNKQTDKLMADNSSLLKKLSDVEKQLLVFKSTGSRDKELAALKMQIVESQKGMAASDQKNASLQAEMGELQKKVTEYSKQINQFKADSKASAEERKKMDDENKLLQSIVVRVMQEDANRNQRRRMIQEEVGKLHLQSGALLQQINYLSQPVVKLSTAERKLFKKPVIEVQDPNTLVAFKTENTQPSGETALPVPAPDLPPIPAPAVPDAAPAPKPPEPAGTDPAKTENPPPGVKPKAGDDLPAKDDPDKKQADSKPPEAGATPALSSGGGAKLPASVKPLADQAKKAFDSEKFAEAERLYDKTLQVAPNNVYLLSNRAVVQYRMGKFKQSEETFKKALAIAPEDAFCWSTIGIVYYQEEKFDDAVSALTKSLAINPRNPTAHNYLGITAAQKGWQEAAQKELESAVQLDPKYGDAWYNLAITLATKQPPDKAEAKKAYQKALELGIPKEQTMEDLLKEDSPIVETPKVEPAKEELPK